MQFDSDKSSLMLSLYLNSKPWECTGEKKVKLPAILKFTLYPGPETTGMLASQILTFWPSLYSFICSIRNDGISHSESKRSFDSASGFERMNADFVWTD
jgi:hypothetical protein